jgi:hypothetical protein
MVYYSSVLARAPGGAAVYYNIRAARAGLVGFRHGGTIKYVRVVCDADHAPARNVLVEGGGAVEHVDHGGDAGDLRPPGEGRVESCGLREHAIHAGDTRYIPGGQVLVENRRGEHVCHVGNAAHVPPGMVMVERIGFVQKGVKGGHLAHVPQGDVRVEARESPQRAARP